jgi:membrane-associated phospholipid phosphatase
VPRTANPRPPRPALAALRLGALGCLAVTLAAAAGWLLPADQSVLGWIAARRDCDSIRLAAALSLLGAGEVSLLITALLAAACLVRRQPRAAAALLVLYVSLPIEVALKHTLAQPLPGTLYPIPGGCEWYRPTLGLATPHSYPSGYAIRVTYFFAIAAALLVALAPACEPRDRRGLLARRDWRAILFRWLAPLTLAVVLALLLATRLVLSWHWPSDLIGGALLGLALAAATVLIARRPAPAPGAPATR